MDKNKLEDFCEQVKKHAFYKTRPKLRRIILELFKHINALEAKISQLKRRKESAKWQRKQIYQASKQPTKPDSLNAH